MATEINKIQYGGDMMLFVGGGTDKLPIAFSTSQKLDVSMTTREISSKDSGYWTDRAAGKLDWNASTDALYTDVLTVTTGVNSFDELYSLMVSRTAINVVFAAKTGTVPAWTVDATKKNFTGTGFITSVSINAPNEDSTTYSITIEGSGALVMA